MVTIKQNCGEKYEERVLFGEMNTLGSTLERDGQLPEQPCMVYFREGTYPIFVPNVSGESDASNKYSYYVPKSIVDKAANQVRDTNYKKWAEDVVAKNNVHKVIFRRKWTVHDIATIEAIWTAEIECYRVEQNFWQIDTETPILAQESTGSYDNQEFKLGKIKVSEERPFYKYKSLEFEMESLSQRVSAWTETPMFLKLNYTDDIEMEDEDLNKIGWERMPYKRSCERRGAYSIIAGEKDGIAKIIDRYVPRMACLFEVRVERNNRNILDGVEGGFGDKIEKREGDRVLGKYDELSGELKSRMQDMGAPMDENLPRRMQINMANMDSKRRREVRSGIPYTWHNFGTWGDCLIWYVEFKTEKAEAFKKAKRIIDVGTWGKANAWKIADASKKQKVEKEDEERADAGELKEMVEKVETEESYRKYLLYKIKILEKAVKSLEGALK